MSLFVTVVETVPKECEEVMQVIRVLEIPGSEQSAPPKLTVALGKKFVPLMVKKVPPEIEPAVGEIEVTEGAAW